VLAEVKTATAADGAPAPAPVMLAAASSEAAQPPLTPSLAPPSAAHAHPGAATPCESPAVSTEPALASPAAPARSGRGSLRVEPRSPGRFALKLTVGEAARNALETARALTWKQLGGKRDLVVEQVLLAYAKKLER